MSVSWWYLIQAHHAPFQHGVQMINFWGLYSLLHTNVILNYEDDPPLKSEESRSQWNEKQASIFHLWLGMWEREKRETEIGSSFFFPNELTEATSISSNVMLKWKLIVQYAATALGHASSISISGGVTKWVCSLGPTPRKADTSPNQQDFSIWHCCAAGILHKGVLYVCVCLCVSKMKSNHTGDANGIGILLMMSCELWVMSKIVNVWWRGAHSSSYPLQCCFIVSITLSFLSAHSCLCHKKGK